MASGNISRRNSATRQQVSRFPDLFQAARSFGNILNDGLNFDYNNGQPCGAIEYTPSYHVTGEGAPSLGNNMLQYFYQSTCDFCFSFPRSPDWIVFIDLHDRDYVMQEAKNLAGSYEPYRKDTDWKFSGAVDKTMSVEAQDVIGCIFSHGVTIPGSSTQMQMIGASPEKNQGFSKIPITNNSADNEPLNIVFKETTCSFIDFFLLPWQKLVSHKGTAARPRGQSLKADITVFHLQPTVPYARPEIRKAYQFYDCVPTNIASEDYNYDSDELIQRQVTFHYNFYTVWDGLEFGNFTERT